MALYKEDTIAAIATPMGTAGIGKIRISGKEAINIAHKLFRGIRGKRLKGVDGYTAHYGFVVDPESEKEIDEVVAIVMREPHSFSGENVVEFDCHGGMVALKKVLELVLDNGARMAEAGEFSKRAFLNGRIDLAQAESIIEVINAKTEKSLDVAVNQLKGNLSNEIEKIKNEAMSILAHLEAAIDFPEDEIEDFNSDKLNERINFIIENINDLLKTSKEGKIYKEGIKTVIVGKPNVGKSSLLNTLIDEKRAIVTDIPGTTRDIIEEVINLEGLPLKIIDTAGIRKTEDMVEKIGVEKAHNSLKSSDLVIMMLDVSQGLTEEDLNIYNSIKNKPLIVAVNKTDLPQKLDREEINTKFSDHPLLWISVKEKEGLKELKKAIVDEVFEEEISDSGDVLITQVRHEKALKNALNSIKRVKDSYQNNMPYDFLTIDLKDVISSLEEITGESVDEDIIDRIFSDFCIGK
ncbi:MAG: tRNA uridine-5-carboxymethylaminomethyl(34) synthesis GTPase MnmE [Bacillota bacterium]